MSVLGAIDAIAVKARTVTGLKECWTATGGGVDSTLKPIPARLDDSPFGLVWLGPASVAGGNAEFLLWTPTLEIWAYAKDQGFAYAQLAPFPDRVLTTFRSDLDLGGEATRCIVAGWDDPEAETVNSMPWLVLPIRLEVLILRLAHDATA